MKKEQIERERERVENESKREKEERITPAVEISSKEGYESHHRTNCAHKVSTMLCVPLSPRVR